MQSNNVFHVYSLRISYTQAAVDYVCLVVASDALSTRRRFANGLFLRGRIGVTGPRVHLDLGHAHSARSHDVVQK